MQHYDPRTPQRPAGRTPSKIDDLSWLGRDPGEQLMSLKFLILIGFAAIPAVLATLSERTQATALRWRVLVPADQAVVTIPTLEAGLDLQRLAVVVLLALAGLSLAIGYAPTAEDRSE